MQHHKTDNTYIIAFSKGEEVFSTLTRFCADEKIHNASFTGIGAVEHLECGYYALDEKKYYFKAYDTLLEVVSLTGNVMLKDSKPFLHAHGVFTDTTNAAFGGHIKEMSVGVALEVILTPLASTLERKHNGDIGLFLIHCT